MAKNTCGTSKLQRSRLHEALLDHRKKTHILQIVSIPILLILSIVFSLLNFFQQPRNLSLKVKETQNWLSGKFCALEENWSK